MSSEIRKFINKVQNWKKKLNENSENLSHEDKLKSILFTILNQSEFISKFDFIHSIYIHAGVPILHTDEIKEKDFFNENLDVIEYIAKIWEKMGLKNYYEDWNEYNGLSIGYEVKDKNSDDKLLVLINRLKDNDFKFEYYINPNYHGQDALIKRELGDHYFEFFGEENIAYTSNDDFRELTEKLRDEVKSVEDVKFLFRYLDALI